MLCFVSFYIKNSKKYSGKKYFLDIFDDYVLKTHFVRDIGVIYSVLTCKIKGSKTHRKTHKIHSQ